MDVDTWVSIGMLLGVAIALLGYLSTAIRGLKADIADVGARVDRLDQRIYDLATGHYQRPLIIPPQH